MSALFPAPSPATEPIAVVGLACRVAGADSTAQFWQLLTDARCTVSDRPNGTRRGALEQPGAFDAAFFGLSPREAAAMDPAQRLLLESAWTALEDAGIAPDSVRGSATGVYIGATNFDWPILLQQKGIDGIDGLTTTGTNRAVLANRISYLLGLQGPSLVLDSAQSSALVALHQACADLRSGECDQAIVGGVNLVLAAESTAAMQRMGALSPSGRCFTFDERADGYVRGEAAVSVVLKRLSAAEAAGDPSYCVIRGSAVNNDGGGSTLTTPDQSAQEAVLRAAYRRAGLDPSQVRYVELHGTGTPVGDPVEAASLGAVIGRAVGGRLASGQFAGGRLAVGSVKTNVGHCEGAAGLVGFAKLALGISRGSVPATVGFGTPHPAVRLEENNLQVLTEPLAWPENAVAGVSSFGMGGTNCHVVVTAAPSARPVEAAESGPVLLSASTPAALAESAAAIADHLDDIDVSEWPATAATLAGGRAQLAVRAVIPPPDPRPGLQALAAGKQHPDVITGRATARRVAFCFPGQGSQWVGMVADLMRESPVFAEVIAAIDAELADFVDWSVAAVLRQVPGAPGLDRVDVVQPATFAVMVGLARLWQSRGVQPAAVIGHSQGEIAAAVISGGLSLTDACRVIALRSKLIAARLAGGGGMAALATSASTATELIREHAGLEIAGHNGPSSTVLAGPAAAIERFVAEAEANGLRCKRIDVDYASHSSAVEVLSDELAAALADLSPRSTDIPFYSTRHARPIDGTELTGRYWFENLRNPVRFAETATRLIGDGFDAVVECSPHPVLTAAVRDLAAEADVLIPVIGSLSRGEGDRARFDRALAEAWTVGLPVDWSELTAGPRRHLPGYAFQRKEFWPDGVRPTADGELPADPVAVVGEPVADSTEPAAELDLLDLVVTATAAVLGYRRNEIDADASFKSHGLESATGVELCRRLSDTLQRPVRNSAVYDHPSPRALATALAGVDRVSPARVETNTTAEPIAVVGMACRLPGGVDSPEALWQLLAEGRDAISEFPTDRGWDLTSLFHDDPDHPGTSYVRHGGFIDCAGEFDAEFFGLSPREALAMDPQQRLLLETSWEALERAGVKPGALRGTPAGVYFGVMAAEYGPGLAEPADGLDGYRLTGSTVAAASGRVSYTLGLTGPAMTVDTACSSSLVAIHLAHQALRAGECSLALAGGAAVMASPGMFVQFSRQRGLAADGRCKPFSDDADGTAWGEGVGVVVLERLSDARRLGHPVLAVLHGSAVNQDGASNGFTAPSGTSQRQVLESALADAGLPAAAVQVVEAHGTGTRLGDPIEAEALMSVYGAESPVLLGSLKANVGHTQAAAGVAGLIKLVTALQHDELPPTLYADRPTRQVDWTEGRLQLLAESTPWPRTAAGRHAGLSSFGISGTNAHLILGDPPAAPIGNPLPSSIDLPLLLSARTEVGVVTTAAQLAAAETDGLSWALATSRTGFDHRAVVDDPAGLPALAAGRPDPSVRRGVASNRRVLFVFPGQGAQWAGMGRQLLLESPVFAARLAECENALAPYVDYSVSAVLRQDPGAPRLERVEVLQPASFAVMLGLAAVWQAAGLQPAGVLGHSQGEIAAAVVSGALSLEDAARVVAVRSRLIAERLAGRGAMAAVALSAERTAELLVGDAAIAAYNGPASTVISGAPESVRAVVTAAKAGGARARCIEVDYASHGPHVEVLLDPLAETLAPIAPARPALAFYSTLEGNRLTDTALDADYWYRNLRGPVRFADAVGQAAADGFDLVIEVSPHPVLATAIESVLETGEVTGAVVVESLRRDDGGLARLITSLSTAWLAGAEVDWTSLGDGRPVVRPDLPTYPFQRNRYWLSRTAPRPQAGSGHPILTDRLDPADGSGTVFTGSVSLDRLPWLADHAVLGTVLLPGTAVLDLLLHAGHELEHPVVDELILTAPVLLPATGEVALQLMVGRPDATGARAATLYARTDGEWTTHATARLTTTDATADLDPALPTAIGPAVDLTARYADLAALGFDYGPAFQLLRSEQRSGDELRCIVESSDDTSGFVIHPARLDAILHSMIDAASDASGPALPFVWNRVQARPTSAATLHGRIVRTGPDSVSVTVAEPDGRVVFSADRLTTRVVAAADLAALTGRSELLHVLDWAPVTESPDPNGDIAIVADLDEFAPALATRPAAVVVELPVADPRTTTLAALSYAQAALAESPDVPVAFLTTNAVSTGSHDLISDTGLAQSPVWGLIRSAQTEQPNRFLLLDTDDADTATVQRAVRTALATGEHQVAVRDGVFLAPRLVRPSTTGRRSVDLSVGTVVVTGASGTLGGLIARRLISEHGARSLLLLSRSGRIEETLPDEAADITARACDLADRSAVAAALADVGPIALVVHAAGVLGDSTIQTLTDDIVDQAFPAKVEGIENILSITAESAPPVIAFASVAGVLGFAGQAGYAAANAYLDGRAATASNVTAIAWGLWDARSAMTDQLDAAGVARLGRQGVRPMTAEAALRAFDQALTGEHRQLIAADFDRSVAAPLLRPRRTTEPAHQAGLADRLSGLAASAQLQLALTVVREQAAAVLGHAAAAKVNPTLPFAKAGFDSLAAVELRNRLNTVAEVRLTSTAVFDHVTPQALAGHLIELLAPNEPVGPDPTELPIPVGAPADDLDFADDDELFSFLDHELGTG